jgi:sulfane dehydrogenase subunit SoxC
LLSSYSKYRPWSWRRPASGDEGTLAVKPAQLQEPVLAKCTTRFRFLWNWDGGPATLMSRAVDETGYVQPSTQQLRDARGVGTRYHYNGIRVWSVNADGAVAFAD